MIQLKKHSQYIWSQNMGICVWILLCALHENTNMYLYSRYNFKNFLLLQILSVWPHSLHNSHNLHTSHICASHCGEIRRWFEETIIWTCTKSIKFRSRTNVQLRSLPCDTVMVIIRQFPGMSEPDFKNSHFKMVKLKNR